MTPLGYRVSVRATILVGRSPAGVRRCANTTILPPTNRSLVEPADSNIGRR